MFINPFRTFDDAKYSHHLIHFTWTVLLPILKAKVQNSNSPWQCLWSTPSFKTWPNRQAVWITWLVCGRASRSLSREHIKYSEDRKETNRQTNTLQNFNIVVCYWVIWIQFTFGNTYACINVKPEGAGHPGHMWGIWLFRRIFGQNPHRTVGPQNLVKWDQISPGVL